MARRSATLKNRWWLSPWEIELYDMADRADENPDGYVSNEAWRRVIRPQLNSARWAPLVQNKWIFGIHYPRFGVTVPQTLGLLHPSSGRTDQGEPLETVEQLARWLRARGTQSFVLKPVGGGLGEGVVIVQSTKRVGGATRFVTNVGHLDQDGLEAQLRMTLRRATGYIVQERVQQHPWFDEINPGAPNSLRLVTFTPASGPPVVQFAVLRLGRTTRMADNWAQGGVAVAVDLSTGELGAGRLKPGFGGWTTDHPDSKIAFVGRSLPRWAECRALAERAAAASPDLRSIGWDVVISDEGPCIVEGNNGWDIQLCQIHSGGLLNLPVASEWASVGVDMPDGSRSWRMRHSPSIRARVWRSLGRRLRRTWTAKTGH